MRTSVLVAVPIPGFVAGTRGRRGHPALPTWSDEYSVNRFVATKHGTGLAASHWKPDFAET